MSVAVQGTSTLLSPSGATSYNVPVPSGSAADDLVLVLALTTGSSTTVITAPDGTWTATTAYSTGSTGSAARLQGFYKTLTAGAPSTYSFTSASSNAIPGFATFLLRRTAGSAWSVVFSGVNLDSSRFYTAPSVALSGPGVAVVAAGARNNSGNAFTVPSGGFVSVFNLTTTGTNTPMDAGGYQVYSSAQTAGTWNFNSTADQGTALISIGVSYAAPIDLSSTIPAVFDITSDIRVTQHTHLSSTVPVVFEITSDIESIVHITLSSTITADFNVTSDIEVIPRTASHLSTTVPIVFDIESALRVSLNPMIDLSSTIPIVFDIISDIETVIETHLSSTIPIVFDVSSEIEILPPIDLSSTIPIVFDVSSEIHVDVPNFVVTLVSPIGASRVPTASPVFSLTIQQQQERYLNATIQIQISTTDDFTSPIEFEIQTSNVFGAVDSVTLTTAVLDDGTTYFWRARNIFLEEGDAPDPWSSVETFTVDLQIGNTAEYGYWGNVIDGVAAPHLWHIATPRIGTGGIVRLIGMGFGDKTAAIVVGEDTLTTATNAVIDATEDGFSDSRVIDSVTDSINVEHDVITAVVSDAVESPGDQVHIEVTE